MADDEIGALPRKELLAKFSTGELYEMDDDDGRRYALTPSQFEYMEQKGVRLHATIPVILRGTRKTDYYANEDSMGGRVPPDTSERLVLRLRIKGKGVFTVKMIVHDVGLAARRIVGQVDCSLSLVHNV